LIPRINHLLPVRIFDGARLPENCQVLEFLGAQITQTRQVIDVLCGRVLRFHALVLNPLRKLPNCSSG